MKNYPLWVWWFAGFVTGLGVGMIIAFSVFRGTAL